MKYFGNVLFLFLVNFVNVKMLVEIYVLVCDVCIVYEGSFMEMYKYI